MFIISLNTFLKTLLILIPIALLILIIILVNKKNEEDPLDTDISENQNEQKTTKDKKSEPETKQSTHEMNNQKLNPSNKGDILEFDNSGDSITKSNKKENNKVIENPDIQSNINIQKNSNSFKNGENGLKQFFPDNKNIQPYRKNLTKIQDFNSNPFSKWRIFGNKISLIRKDLTQKTNFTKNSNKSLQNKQMKIIGSDNNLCFFVSLIQNIMNNSPLYDYIKNNGGGEFIDTINEIYRCQNKESIEYNDIKKIIPKAFPFNYKFGDFDNPSNILTLIFKNYITSSLKKNLFFYTTNVNFCSNGCINDNRNFKDPKNQDINYDLYPISILPRCSKRIPLQEYLYGLRKNESCQSCKTDVLYDMPFFSSSPPFLIFQMGSQLNSSNTTKQFFPSILSEVIKVRSIADGETEYALTGFIEYLFYHEDSLLNHFIAYIKRDEGYYKLDNMYNSGFVGTDLKKIEDYNTNRTFSAFYERIK